MVSDGADDVRVGSFGLDFLLDIRDKVIVRFRDARSEFCCFLANLPIKRVANKIARNREYSADGDEEERGVGEKDFVMEFYGLGVLFYRFGNFKSDLKPSFGTPRKFHTFHTFHTK